MIERLFIGCIRLYRYFLGPWWGGQCRFSPTCSEYAIDALRRHGPWKGGWLAVRRLSRCHPWHAGGFDPAP